VWWKGGVAGKACGMGGRRGRRMGGKVVAVCRAAGILVSAAHNEGKAGSATAVQEACA